MDSQQENLFHDGKNLILASASPRRRHYLSEMGVPYETAPVDIDERPQVKEAPEAFVQRIALAKWHAAAKIFPGRWILAADTIVFLQDEIFGKPASKDEALSMLLRLRGKAHVVATSFVLGCNEYLHQQIVKTRVVFDNFPERFAREYAETGEGLDKAGAYGIQGKGAVLVLAIDGSYTNVVGLPLAEVMKELDKCGIAKTKC